MPGSSAGYPRAVATYAKRRVAGALRKRLAPGYGVKANHELANIRIPADVVVYFPDSRTKLYQLRQWLPVLEKLDKRHPVLIVTRNVHTNRDLRNLTRLRSVFVRRFADLIELYYGGTYKIAVYVNNSTHNFQSLSFREMLHLHINHGESDKICMVSNQVKAYDRVFVAGRAAVERHKAALFDFDVDKLVPVGRPQLDLPLQPAAPPSSQLTVLYAPTWEGEDDSNNYTSVDVYGPDIVARILAVPSTRLVYKPHPRVPESSHVEVSGAHQRIMELIEEARGRDPERGHHVDLTGDILTILPACDVLVSDVSSVVLDFLYLRTDSPMFIADRRGDASRLHRDSPVSRAADIIDGSNVADLGRLLCARIEDDVHADDRKSWRRYYFGDLAVGESTERFLAAVDDAVAHRDHVRAEKTGRDSGRDDEAFARDMAASGADGSVTP